MRCTGRARQRVRAERARRSHSPRVTRSLHAAMRGTCHRTTHAEAAPHSQRGRAPQHGAALDGPAHIRSLGGRRGLRLAGDAHHGVAQGLVHLEAGDGNALEDAFGEARKAIALERAARLLLRLRKYIGADQLGVALHGIGDLAHELRLDADPAGGVVAQEALVNVARVLDDGGLVDGDAEAARLVLGEDEREGLGDHVEGEVLGGVLQLQEAQQRGEREAVAEQLVEPQLGVGRGGRAVQQRLVAPAGPPLQAAPQLAQHRAAPRPLAPQPRRRRRRRRRRRGCLRRRRDHRPGFHR
mmetsp:Transcript_860/g.2534  ORF Transcript_860/g.2534 Transcript_860/m.2534 type:complete len:298 (+) Transcript_860:2398-3291(+)